MKHRILVLRFSAFGDVAMTIPVIREFIQQNPNVEIIYVSREKFKDLFDDIPNFTFYSADLEGENKGILGLYRLSKELKSLDITEIADLHNVLRTNIIRKFISHPKTAILNKSRKERKALVRSKNKVKKQLKPMVERYADVFRELGFELNLSHQLISQSKNNKENAIGIAPFAMYEGKMYPLDKMRTVALKMAEQGVKVYLFGGKYESKTLESWEKLNPNIQSIAGKYDLKTELEIIKKIKIMISMDSANMHLASLIGTRVISIWGNTHPFMGFLGYGQSWDDVIQDESMEFRPTSVFGKEPKNAEKIDYFQNINPEAVVDKIILALEEMN